MEGKCGERYAGISVTPEGNVILQGFSFGHDMAKNNIATALIRTRGNDIQIDQSVDYLNYAHLVEESKSTREIYNSEGELVKTIEAEEKSEKFPTVEDDL